MAVMMVMVVVAMVLIVVVMVVVVVVSMVFGGYGDRRPVARSHDSIDFKLDLNQRIEFPTEPRCELYFKTTIIRWLSLIHI